MEFHSNQRELTNTENLYAVIDPNKTLTEIHKDNNTGFIPLRVQGTTGITDEPKITIKAYALDQNYPNPFNPATTIKYQIPRSGNVTLKVYDILGKEVATLVNDYEKEGYYFVNFSGSRLASGVYIYQLKANDYISSKKMILIK